MLVSTLFFSSAQDSFWLKIECNAMSDPQPSTTIINANIIVNTDEQQCHE
jgi:hypothetical protein